MLDKLTELHDSVFSPPAFDLDKLTDLLRTVKTDSRLAKDPSEIMKMRSGRYQDYGVDSRRHDPIPSPFGGDIRGLLDIAEYFDDEEDDPLPIYDAAYRIVSETTEGFFSRFDRDTFGNIAITRQRNGIPSVFDFGRLCNAAFVHDVTGTPSLTLEIFLNGGYGIRLGKPYLTCLLRPKIYTVNRRIHRTDGPAIIWPSGKKEYYLKGLHIPPFFITQRKRLAIKNMHIIGNAELRRAFIECFGADRLLQSKDVEKIQQDKYGVLYHYNDGTIERSFVQVTNGTPNPDGSPKHYYLWVPDDMESAHEAVAWSYGLTKRTYHPNGRT